MQAISADLTSASSSKAALHDAVQAFGGVAPDWVVLSAGFSKPQLFLETSEEDLRKVSDSGEINFAHFVRAWMAFTGLQHGLPR